MGLAFLASLVLVTILLPNIYFRLMLLTDQASGDYDEVMLEEKVLLCKEEECPHFMLDDEGQKSYGTTKPRLYNTRAG